MEFDLITEEEFENLPDDPEQKFVMIEAICRRSMNRLISENTPADFDTLIRMQYMTTVAASAMELGIEGILYPGHLENPAHGLSSFMLAASAAVTKIRLRGIASRQHSVLLSPRTRGRIELQIRKLRDVIDAADIPPEKRKALREKLDQLSLELDRTRVSFAKTMALIAYISFGVTTSTSFLADAPDALATITSLFGQDKEAEEKEAKRLEGPSPRKALPSPDDYIRRSDQVVRNVSFDDDIPF